MHLDDTLMMVAHGELYDVRKEGIEEKFAQPNTRRDGDICKRGDGAMFAFKLTAPRSVFVTRALWHNPPRLSSKKSAAGLKNYRLTRGGFYAIFAVQWRIVCLAGL